MSKKRTSYIREALKRLRQAETAEQRANEIDRLMPMVVSLAARVAGDHLGDRDAANEIAQDVAVKFFVNIDSLVPEKMPGLWVITVATREAISAYRRRTNAAKYLAELRYATESDERCAPLSCEAAEDLRLAIDSLPLRERFVVNRRYFFGDRPSEIATSMGLPVDTVYALLASARRRLRKILLRNNAH